jgi:glutamyl/glutaminyl-tRNA synthetase
VTGDRRPDGVARDALPSDPTTRFAPAPTGLLHLGHVANALFTWGLAGAAAGRGRVVLRIEDHDRQRSRPEFERALLADLAWLGFVPDRPGVAELDAGDPSPYRQSDNGEVYRAALERLSAAVPVYRCTCSRADVEGWAGEDGDALSRTGCPGGCRARHLGDGPGAVRAAIGSGEEAWEDLLLGPRSGPVATSGDPIVRDRLGNWTYPFAVVVDDLRQGIDLVVRGHDLPPDTPRQIRLARLLGRPIAPTFAHHPLVLRADGTKLSKSAGDTGVRELRAEGWSAERVIGAAAAAVGLVPPGTPVAAADAPRLVADRAALVRR